MASTYGKKGQQGANAGKRASTYEFLIDGKPYTKKSFTVHTERAFAGYFWHNGNWYVSGIWEKPPEGTNQQFVAARKRNNAHDSPSSETTHANMQVL